LEVLLLLVTVVALKSHIEEPHMDLGRLYIHYETACVLRLRNDTDLTAHSDFALPSDGSQNQGSVIAVRPYASVLEYVLKVTLRVVNQIKTQPMLLLTETDDMLPFSLSGICTDSDISISSSIVDFAGKWVVVLSSRLVQPSSVFWLECSFTEWNCVTGIQMKYQKRRSNALQSSPETS
jgi:hypothetical protein